MLVADHVTIPGRLDGVSAQLAPGRVTAIVGPNGAGKSTLLSALAGLIPAPVTIDGAPIASLSPRDRARTIGYLPQTGEVAWNVSVETLVGLGRLPCRSDAAQDRVAIDAAMDALALSGLRHRAVASLSGGERARALLARVLAGDPRWILADEPLASLDLAHARGLIGHLRRQAAGGIGVVLVVHDLAVAMNHADHAVVLDRGRVVAAGPVGEALDEAVIARVWGIEARWLGSLGARALVW